MTKGDVVLALIRSAPGLTDQQIRQRLSMQYVAHVNGICRQLQDQGKIQRLRGPQGQLVNVPVGVEATGVPRSMAQVRLAPRSNAATGGEPVIADAWQQIMHLELARTLLVIPCSAAKVPGGAVDNGPLFGELSPPELAQRLAGAQAVALQQAHVDASRQSAWQRYRGAFYQAAGTALEVAIQEEAHLLILSGGYGVLLAQQPIGDYNAVLRPGWWPDHLLQDCLVAYARRQGLTAVVAFAGRHTPYARIVRSTAWRGNGIDRAFLFSPLPDGQGGALVKVPRTLGEAFAALWSGTLNKEWRSSDGLALGVEVLS